MIDIFNSLAFQSLMYFGFVIIFQSLNGTLRTDKEFYMTKRVMQDFVFEDFDTSHNSFVSIRRVADIYEWGNRVLFPSLFGRTEPCNPDTVGALGTPKTCTDHAWADGEGSFRRTPPLRTRSRARPADGHARLDGRHPREAGAAAA